MVFPGAKSPYRSFRYAQFAYTEDLVAKQYYGGLAGRPRISCTGIGRAVVKYRKKQGEILL